MSKKKRKRGRGPSRFEKIAKRQAVAEAFTRLYTRGNDQARGPTIQPSQGDELRPFEGETSGDS